MLVGGVCVNECETDIIPILWLRGFLCRGSGFNMYGSENVEEAGKLPRK